MGQHFVFALILACCSFAVFDAKTHKHTVKIVEGGKVFIEKVFVNVGAGLEYFHVPAHGKVEETIVVFDYNKGLVLTKYVKHNVCYLRKLEKSDASPRTLESALEMENLRKPWKRYITQRTTEVILRFATPEEMDSKLFKKVCGSNKVSYMIRAPANKKAMEKLVKKIVTAATSGKTKRSQTVRKFVTCTALSSIRLGRCLSKDPKGKHLRTTCRFKARGCIYTTTCKFQNGGFFCRRAHNLHKVFCCDFRCNV